MIKFIIAFQFVFLTLSTSIACTFEPKSFCSTAKVYRANDIVISGVITSVDTLGIDFQVIHIFRGEVDSLNIRIWDGTDQWCMETLSMAAADLGLQNDTLIITLPLIDSIENVWDVIGDYRRPDPYGFTPSLTVKNGFANGLIKGWYASSASIRSYDYFEFIEDWSEECDNITSSLDSNIRQFKSYPNPTHNFINLESSQFNINEKLKIIDVYGNLLRRVVVESKKISIDLSSFRPGVYAVLDERNMVISVITKI